MAYHTRVMQEMERRGYQPTAIWSNPYYRGWTIGEQQTGWTEPYEIAQLLARDSYIYPEHNEEYLLECVENLASKGIRIKI